MKKKYSIGLLLIVIVLVSCQLFPTGTSNSSTPVFSTITTTAISLPTATQTVVIPTTSTSPRQSITPNPIETPISTTLPTEQYTYAVIFVKEGEVLNIHTSPDPESAVIAQYSAKATGIELSGKDKWINDNRWVEVVISSNQTGWVNSYYLTEWWTPRAFCADVQIITLLSELQIAVSDNDGKLLASLISPSHGLNLHYFRFGNVANYNTEEAKWLFQSDYIMNWGLHPASGLEVKGIFREVVLPHLSDVLLQQYTLTCHDLATGGSSYIYLWPFDYSNINFVSMYKPGSPGVELDWRTWLVGIEYVKSKPYLFALIHLFWEP